MVVSDESIEAELEGIIIDIQRLKSLWRDGNYEEYRVQAQRFLRERRQVIRTAAKMLKATLGLVRCLEGLLVVEDILPEYDDEVRRSDEDLLIEVMEQFHPEEQHQARRHAFQKHTRKSNIYKRRSFTEATDGKLDLSAALMGEAVRSARQALQVSPDAKSDGVSKHLQYLTFHWAILRMRAYEAKGQLDKAHTCWEEASLAVQDPRAPADLFPGYIWDRDDLNAYSHLIDAQRNWSQRDFQKAVMEYDSWLASVQKHKRRWRFRNVEVRRHLCMVLSCLTRKCDGCDQCRQAAEHLQSLAQDWYLGAAGRYLAAEGFALKQVGAFAPDALDAIVDELKTYIPLESYHPEPSSKLPEGHFLKDLPSYFISLPSEVKRLEQIGYAGEGLREFILRRLREFLEINCEYEEGRVATVTGSKPSSLSSTSLPELGETLVTARRSRKGSKDRGTSEWESVARILAQTEMAKNYKEVLDTYDHVLTKVSGLFPTVVRVVQKQDADDGHLAIVETLTGYELRIESQFPLEGDFAYLPPRYRRNPADLKLLANDRSWWVPSRRVQGMYTLQGVPVWDGAWSELRQEHFESFSLDYKQQLPKRLGKHLAAFANTEGGWLVIGIYDPKVAEPEDCVRGLTLEEAAEALDKIGLTGVNEVVPPIVPTTFFRAYPDGKLVILCKTRASHMRPHRLDGRIYIRVGAQSMPISEDRWKGIVQTKKGKCIM